jgi:hypothetical protein
MRRPKSVVPWRYHKIRFIAARCGSRGACKAHLLDDVGDVRPGEDEVLQRPNKTLVAGGISHREAIGGGYLALSVHRSRARLTVSHAAGSMMLTTVMPRKWCNSLRSFITNSCWREEMMHRRRSWEEAEDDVVDVEKVRHVQDATEDEHGGPP